MLILITSLISGNPSPGFQRCPLTETVPSFRLPYAEMIPLLSWPQLRHIWAVAHWCQVLELNQQANRPRHVIRMLISVTLNPDIIGSN